MKLRKLTPEEEEVIVRKGTEAPFTGEYDRELQARHIRLQKVRRETLQVARTSSTRRCGWPSFDHEIKGAVKRVPDPDGMRTEIECANCGAHLGHVFSGEGLPKKNVRHCVNSISMLFIPKKDEKDGQVKQVSDSVRRRVLLVHRGGVQDAQGSCEHHAGLCRRHRGNPTYEQVCTGNTGHAEVLKIEYDPKAISLDTLLDVFFTMHDPTSMNRQGS